MKFLWLALFIATSSRAATFTMADAIRAALRESPSYDSAEKTTLIDDLQYRNAIAKLLPSIDLTTSDGLQNNVPISSTSNLLLAPNPTAPLYSTRIAEMKKFLNIFALLMASIALLSLIVGGIGINNMMLVSVTERLKEFGIRKALGAAHFSIRTQVLMESIALCVVAGLIGIILRSSGKS